jgi:hypothetical protein
VVACNLSARFCFSIFLNVRWNREESLYFYYYISLEGSKIDMRFVKGQGEILSLLIVRASLCQSPINFEGEIKVLFGEVMYKITLFLSQKKLISVSGKVLGMGL